MANVDSAFGLRPVRTLSGAPWTGQVTTMVVPASDGTALFVGDPVKLLGAEDTTEQMATVAQAAAGARIFGVVVGFEADPDNLFSKYRTASTKRLVRIIPATAGVVFECQADAAVTAGDTGSVFDLVIGAGNTATGRSTAEVDIGTLGTTNGQVQVIGMSKNPDLTFDTAAAGTNLEVIINESDFTEVGGV